jgi:hypothetical protein
MINPRLPVLLASVLVSLAGCTSRAGSSGNVSGAARDFLGRYGNFSPAEAKEITRQIEAGPHDLAVQLAAASREGILLKLGDLQPALPSPERNAAPIYVQLANLLKAKPLDPATDKVRGSLGVRVLHSPEEVDAVRRMLSERKDVMQLVHEAASKPECVFRRDWSRGLLLEFPENATMREAARLLSAESYFLAQQGRYSDAIANQTQVFRVAQHPTAVPVAICQLVAMSCDAMALAGMENIVSMAGPNAEIAEEVRAAIAGNRPRLQLRHTLEGEIAGYTISMNSLRQKTAAPAGMSHFTEALGGGDGNGEGQKKARKLSPGERRVWNRLLDAAAAYHLSVMRRLIAASSGPYFANSVLLKRLFEQGESETHNPVQVLAPAAILAGLITHATEARAQEEVIMAGAAVLAYEGRHSTFPDRLAQAIPEPPLDPFSAGPLKYRREGDGFVVYSLGPDGNFDGSKPGAPRERDQAYFRYPATPTPPQQNR